MASVGTLRPAGLRRRLTLALDILENMPRTYELQIPFAAAEEAIRQALSLSPQNRSDFFSDFRSLFVRNIEKSLPWQADISSAQKRPQKITKNAKITERKPIKKLTGFNGEKLLTLDPEFAIRYGVSDYSLEALNYLDRSACLVPCLNPFITLNDFTIGNILIPAPNEDVEINVLCEQGVELIGVASEVSKTKRASYIALLGVRFDRGRLAGHFEYQHTCQHNSDQLDEIRIGAIHYPVIYACRTCGQLFTCECFNGSYDVENDILRYMPYGNSEKSLAEAVQRISSRKNICSICTGRVPRHMYGHSMYYSGFMQRYLPYSILFARRRYGRDVFEGEPEAKEIENETRRTFGFHEIGKKWMNETILFKIVSSLLEPREVIHHYRGKELFGLELDIWVPSLRLGIEYQGEQHFNAIEHWGGKEGLAKRMENDALKKIVCQSLGYTLVEFDYREEITEELVQERLRDVINATSNSEDV